MHIAVLAQSGSWYVRDLQRAAGERHTITPVAFRDLTAMLGEGEESFSCGESISRLNDVDAVLVRTMPPGSLEQVVFRMDVLARLEAAGRAVVNSAKAIETSVDKYLATARLQAAGLLVPPTIVCQGVDEAMAAFERLGRDVVLKPIFGGEGRGITRLNDEALALRAFKMLAQLGSVLYLQQFVPHDGADWRLLVIGRRVLGMTRRNPLDWRTNVSRGATAEPLEVTPELAELAQRAAAAVGASIAGVDLLPGKDGRLYAIEVNGVPGWKALAAALDVDVARLVLEHLESVAS